MENADSQHIEEADEVLEEVLDRMNELEQRVESLEEEKQDLREELQDEREQRERAERKLDAVASRSGFALDVVSELQSRELEKGAHLLEEYVDPERIEISEGRLEVITKEDGSQYVRLPENEDPLERGGDVALGHGDLLPIQQLARIDDEQLRSVTDAIGPRTAARLWRDRENSSRYWKQGSSGIREYLEASEIKTFIVGNNPGISDDAAQKRVDRTIEALVKLSGNRLGVVKKNHRKDGLKYKERHVVLKEDASIPGDAPRTSDVDG